MTHLLNILLITYLGPGFILLAYVLCTDDTEDKHTDTEAN